MSCAYEGCTVTPRFNTKGVKPAVFCATHKLDGMIDVISQRCEFPECDTMATFNFAGKRGRRFCSQHKLDGMVDVKHKTCAHTGCTKVNAVFHYPGNKKGVFCAAHKQDGMINVISHRCAFVGGCDKHPIYNLPGENVGKFCVAHREPDMVDVVNRRCAFTDGCDVAASYGFPGRVVERCKQHIEDGMIFKSKTKCKEPKCNQPAIYGGGVHEAKACPTHKKPEHVNLVWRKCSKCDSTEILNQQSLCVQCDETTNFRKYYPKVKENEIKKMLDEHGFEYDYDRVVDLTKGVKFRPDFRFHCGTHVVFLEVDENQHKHRASREYARMTTISQAYDGLPVRFIRYNPDAYVVGDDNAERKNPSFPERATLLRYVLQRAIDEVPNISVSIKYMFYDRRENTPWTPLSE